MAKVNYFEDDENESFKNKERIVKKKKPLLNAGKGKKKEKDFVRKSKEGFNDER